MPSNTSHPFLYFILWVGQVISLHQDTEYCIAEGAYAALRRSVLAPFWRRRKYNMGDAAIEVGFLVSVGVMEPWSKSIAAFTVKGAGVSEIRMFLTYRHHWLWLLNYVVPGNEVDGPLKCCLVCRPEKLQVQGQKADLSHRNGESWPLVHFRDFWQFLRVDPSDWGRTLSQFPLP